MNTDNTQGDAEPSLASAGSRPVAWAVEWKGDTTIDRSTFCYTEDGARCKADECPALDGVLVPLYRRPTLTDEEREAIQRAIDSQQDRAAEMHSRSALSRSRAAEAIEDDCDTLRWLLQRTK
jgi:hypothetical protein